MNSQASYLQNLNPSQHQAVTHQGGALLVFAGAGSGKTRVLTRRISHLIQSGQASPQEIFAVTFTNKAAKEMKARIDQMLGFRRAPEFVSTFHSACLRILRNHATALDYRPDFSIYDRSDSMSAMKRVYKAKKIDTKLIEPRAVLNQIDRAKNAYLFADHFREQADRGGYLSEQSALIYELFDAYQQELHQSNAMDFGDLICNVVTLFSLDSKIREHYQSRFTHILVDEYQDTNKVQYMLIKLLAEPQGNLCVVGDDDQSIYSFRGADISNMRFLQKRLPRSQHSDFRC